MGHIKLAVPSYAYLVFARRAQPFRPNFGFGRYGFGKSRVFCLLYNYQRQRRVKAGNDGANRKEFIAKKKAIEEKYEALIGKIKSEKGQEKAKDPDVLGAEIDAEVTRLKDAWSHETDSLESIRDQARQELKSIKKWK